ncbi:DUF805 domain-containing protein [Roseivivax sediminis]|uniref:DUF805 domain-containing protein n=1 Tax=Roseivivax sediminis TaxID=936889 RepID=A0A1I1ZE19_9RHOB|nr:DUF805 domain-containing protein [Roseivivax sediminis]SFE29976.1 Protein of unknown function [Roseivivax sediminis]
MTPKTAITRALSNYATFSGRAVRAEYWWFALFFLVGGLLLGVVDATLFGTNVATTRTGDGAASLVLRGASGPISTIFSLALIVPFLAVGWRRMHDTGRRGLYLLYPFIVMIGLTAFLDLAGPALERASTGIVFTALAGIGLFALALSPLVVFYWLSRPSEPRENQWGPVPAEAAS